MIAAHSFGNFSAEVTDIRRAADAASLTTDQLYVGLRIHLLDGETTTVYFPFSGLEKLDLEKTAFGIIYKDAKAKKQLREMIRDNIVGLHLSPHLPVYYPSTGLFLDPHPTFIAGNQIITSNSSSDGPVLLDRPLQLAMPNDSSTPDITAFLDALGKDLAHRIPAFAYTINSHLRSFWHKVGIETCGVLYLVGTQGYGKTSLAENFCTLYNAGSLIADRYDAHSTPPALRLALADARDRVVLFDDICKSTNRREERQRMDTALNLLRTAANGSPIAKTQGGKTVSLACSSGLVLTGELLSTVPSELTRCIILNIDEPYSGGTPQDRSLAANALYIYLTWFVNHVDEELERCHLLLAEHSALDRTRKNYFQLNFAFDSFLRAIQTPDLSPHIQNLSHTADKIFMNCLNWQTQYLVKQQRQQNPFSKPLKDYISYGIRTKSLHPVMHLGSLCITTEELLQFLQQIDPHLQTRDMTARLKEEGLLDLDQSGKSTKKVKGRRYLHLKL